MINRKIWILLLCAGIVSGCGKRETAPEPVIIVNEEPGQLSANIVKEQPDHLELPSETEPPVSEIDSDKHDESQNVPEPPVHENGMPDISANTIPELPEEALLPESEENMNPERTEYQDGFYYEPLSDEIKGRMNGYSYPPDCPIPYDDLRYVSVLYRDFNGTVQTGEMVCNKSIAQDVVEIFYELFQASYPIEKIRLIDEYNADDDLSCQDNNTSSFCYRTIAGSTKLSKHAQGLAIDINPFYNPYITYPNGVPTIKLQDTAVYADRSAEFIAKIDHNDLAYKLFTKHGFTWGGDWKSVKDYQHFQK